MMKVDEALAIITSRLTPVEDIESVEVSSADGRTLAADVIAPINIPSFMNSAVDGYAVRGEDVPVGGEREFKVQNRVTAGAIANEVIRPGHVIRIFTGAPMPPGADTVYMQEDVEVGDGTVLLPPGLEPGANVRLAGEDISQGSIALSKGKRMRPQDVALAAALGLTELAVRRRPRVAVFSTGNEVVAPGEERAAAQLFDSNRTMLSAMLLRLGCEVMDLGILRDDRAMLAAALKQAAQRCDLILTTGGVSTGEEDHVRAAIEIIGSLVFWRMAIKPGRPVAMGVIDGTPFIGLPGNPVAGFVTFTYVVRPAILALAGTSPIPLVPLRVRAAFDYRKKAGRREYIRVALKQGDAGFFDAVKFPREGAGLLSSLVQTDGLVELEETVSSIKPGDLLNFLPYSSLL
ncbi:Molybdopterin molybdenumtransferase [Afipia felis]|uniref:Molybdopterin molybdenumtransferase n=3 Tax=Afipia felis TaxID=1035 RepID=A0A380W9F7_AFIFE|nr:molybdenum cofactor synthesis domain-containing protein [Afipia felis ATCC 53690]SUU77516.1 Molybdopterin molybdenumtransferase [Afipia felis]SUU85581.1 Molybdopterin molybdenumtransferase [Afipia felis]